MSQMIELYWTDRANSTFAPSELMDVLHRNASAIFNPLIPARASKTLWNSVLEQLPKVTVIKLAAHNFLDNADSIYQNDSFVNKVRHFELTVRVGKWKYDEDWGIKSTTETAIEHLHNLRGLATRMASLHVVVKVHTIGTADFWWTNAIPTPREEVNRSRVEQYMSGSLAEIIAAMREMKLKFGTISFAQRRLGEKAIDMQLSEPKDFAREMVRMRLLDDTTFRI